MKLLRWLRSLFNTKKGYTLEFPIGFQKNKRKRLALFGGPHHFKKGETS